MSFSLKEHWPWTAAAAGIAVLLWLLSPILTPFVIGAGLAYLGDPLANWLQKKKLSRTGAVTLVFVLLGVLLLIALLLLIPMLYNQFIVLMQSIPDWLRWLQENALPKLGLVLPEGIRLDAEGLKKIITQHWSQAGGAVEGLWQSVSSSGAAIMAAVANLLLVPVVSFYLLRDWDGLLAWIRGMIPPRTLSKVTELAHEVDDVLGAFMRGQLLVMAALAALYSIGLALAGLQLALVIGLLAGLLSFVPYLGFIVGFGAACIAMLVQTHEWLPLVWVAAVFGIGQFAESAFLTPTLVGDKIGLHPVAVIFAIMAGGQLFGFTGVLLALPAAAVLAVLLRHTRLQWLKSPLYLGDDKVLHLPVEGVPPGDLSAAAESALTHSHPNEKDKNGP